MTERTTREGIGAPIIAGEWEAGKDRRQKLAPSRIFRTVTAVAQFQWCRSVLEFYDPLADHSAHQNPQAIEDVLHILKAYAK